MARHGRHGAPHAAVRAPSAPATGPFGFSRNTRHETHCQARGKCQREFPGFHETRLFFESRPCCRVGRKVMREGRQARRLQGGIYEAVRKRVERGLSESREKNNDFFRIPTRFTTRYIPLFPTMTRKDSDKPLPPIKRLRALRQPEPRLNLPFSPRGEAKWVRGPSGLGASRAEEKGAGCPLGRPEFRGFHETRDTKHESRLFFESRPLLWRGMERLWRGMGGDRPPHRQHGFMHFTNHETQDTGLLGAPRKPARIPRFSRNTRHETRITAFFRTTAFVVARHGAAMARHGRRPPPAPATRVYAFHETRDSRHGFAWRAAQASANSEVFTKHETRDTNHGLYAFLPTISRHFPLFPGKKITANQVPPRAAATWKSASGSVRRETPFGAGNGAAPGGRDAASLHCSPRGEAKCVRGPLGRGASRLARAGVLE